MSPKSDVETGKTKTKTASKTVKTTAKKSTTKKTDSKKESKTTAKKAATKTTSKSKGKATEDPAVESNGKMDIPVNMDLSTVIVLDTETTGLDHKSEKLIEIGAVKMVNGEVVDKFSTLVNPEKEIRHSSFLVHGISQEEVEDAPNIEEVLPKLLEFMGDYPFVAHNALFDYSFINEACKAVLGERLQNPRIDTFEMYRCVFPEEQSHGLSSLLNRFDFNPDVKHRALDDAENLARVYPRLQALYDQKHDWQLSQLPNIDYLFERYLRIQKAIQAMQSEMADLKDVFKLHFLRGGKSIKASTGEMMNTGYRRTYVYNEEKVWECALKGGFEQKCFKLNSRAVDKLIDRREILEELREELLDARLSMNESRQVNFFKAQPKDTSQDDESSSSK